MAKTNVRKATFVFAVCILLSPVLGGQPKNGGVFEIMRRRMLSNTPPFCLAILTLASFWVKRKKRKPMGGFQDA